MFYCFLLLILGYFGGSSGSRHDQQSRNQFFPEGFNQERKQYLINNVYHTNDYVDHSGGIARLRPPTHILHTAKASATQDGKIAIRVHQPREDPKLFYQSKAYLEEINGQNINNEVASIYPGREVIRADEKYQIPMHLLRSRSDNNQFNSLSKICIQCPSDKTLIAKKGMNRVFLQNPILRTCSGRRAPRNVGFAHMYGPKFGTLLPYGTHIILGRITYNNNTIQNCKTQVHVVIQSCPTPKYLVSQCDDSKTCKFTCFDDSLQLQGESKLVCGEDMTWQGHLPLCRARKWCKPIPPPDYGQISCRGTTSGYTAGLAEGSRCRIRCPLGSRWYPKPVTVCRRGKWTISLKCIPKNDY